MIELSAREAKELRVLSRRRNRDESSLFVVEGVRGVEDLLESALTVEKVIFASTIADTERGSRLLGRARVRGVEIRGVPAREFDRLAATESPQKVIAIATIPEENFDSIRTPGAVVVLDGLGDPGNLGALVRSSEALGAAAVIALPGTVDPWNPKSVRAAAGSSFRIPIIQATWSDTVAELRGRDFEIWGADMAGGPVPETRPARVALVLGNEGAGLSAAVRDGLDRLVGVPTRGRAESLNVAAAGAILLYELAG